jgi:hypothetical protein
MTASRQTIPGLVAEAAERFADRLAVEDGEVEIFFSLEDARRKLARGCSSEAGTLEDRLQSGSSTQLDRQSGADRVREEKPEQPDHGTENPQPVIGTVSRVRSLEAGLA